tara:strand:- start:5254 stop:5478 length:225 start_codon:yes stop_codon:yes gene_type:complete
MRRLGNTQAGSNDLKETGPPEFDSSGIKNQMLYRGSQTVPANTTWTIDSGDSAVIAGPFTVTGSIVVTGTLVIV